MVECRGGNTAGLAGPGGRQVGGLPSHGVGQAFQPLPVLRGDSHSRSMGSGHFIHSVTLGSETLRIHPVLGCVHLFGEDAEVLSPLQLKGKWNRDPHVSLCTVRDVHEKGAGS